MKIKVFGACHTHLGEELDFDGPIDNVTIAAIVDNELTWEHQDLDAEDCDMYVELTTMKDTVVYKKDFECLQQFKAFITGIQMSAITFARNMKED